MSSKKRKGRLKAAEQQDQGDLESVTIEHES
jgi:hypothetical protein